MVIGSNMFKQGAKIGLGTYVYYSVSDNTAVTKKIIFRGNDHMCGLLFVDINRNADLYVIGGSSNVKVVSKSSSADNPSISGTEISVPLFRWSSFIFISFSGFCKLSE